MSKVFRLSEVAEHKVTKGADKSIWIALHDKVYDVTKFLDEVRGVNFAWEQRSYLKIISKSSLSSYIKNHA